MVRSLLDAGGAGALQRERAAMEACATHGVRVPVPGELVDIEGRPGLVMERLPGDDMLSAIAEKPWTIFSAGATTGRIHAALNAVAAPPDLPSARSKLRDLIGGGHRIPQRLRTAALAELERLPDGRALCHGDFHPGNVMLAADGSPVIIDWPHAAAGSPAADFARTLVLLSAGRLPPGTSLLMRLEALVGRKALVHAYHRAYLSHAARPPENLDRWIFVQATARLEENIQGERQNLLRMAAPHWRRIRAGART